MRNLRHSEMRRSSAAGLSGPTSQRPPLPPKIETRCHSYDGLLGDDKKRAPEGRDKVDGHTAAASTKATPEPVKPTPEESIKAKNRRSRSMDDLFDDDRAVADFLENTQSMENLSDPPPPPPQPVPTSPEPDSPVKTMGNICLNRRFVAEPPADSQRSADTASPESCYEEPCENEVITVDSTPRGAATREDDAISTTSSLNSAAGSAGKKNSPFINKYVKKVKSLMKK